MSDSFLLPLPLKENTADVGWSEPKVKDTPYVVPVNIRDVELQIGWSPELPKEAESDEYTTRPFQYEGQTLWYFSPWGYYRYEPIQKIAISRTQGLRARGLFY